jgi:hypothetical protein
MADPEGVAIEGALALSLSTVASGPAGWEGA